jgi:hypothetical protein
MLTSTTLTDDTDAAPKRNVIVSINNADTPKNNDLTDFSRNVFIHYHYINMVKKYQ